MPRPCSICTHPNRAEIDKALVSGTPFRIVSKRFDTSVAALQRHREAHLAEHIERAERRRAVKIEQQVTRQEAKRDADALDVMTELRRLFVRMNKLMDACDQWLTDPDDPERYDLSPRAHEVNVIYEETVDGANGRDRIVTRKKTLQALLDEVEGVAGDGIQIVETKHADPRDLIVKTAGALRPSIELLAKLLGQIDERTVNIFVSSDYLAIRGALMETLGRYPEVAIEVAGRLVEIEGGDEA